MPIPKIKHTPNKGLHGSDVMREIDAQVAKFNKMIDEGKARNEMRHTSPQTDPRIKIECIANHSDYFNNQRGYVTSWNTLISYAAAFLANVVDILAYFKKGIKDTTRGSAARSKVISEMETVKSGLEKAIYNMQFNSGLCDGDTARQNDFIRERDKLKRKLGELQGILDGAKGKQLTTKPVQNFIAKPISLPPSPFKLPSIPIPDFNDVGTKIGVGLAIGAGLVWGAVSAPFQGSKNY